MSISETMREIVQERLDRQHDESAAPEYLAYFHARIARAEVQDSIEQCVREGAPVLGHLGIRMTDAEWSAAVGATVAAKAERDAMRARGETPPEGIRGIAGLPAWAVRELWGYVAAIGPDVTLSQAREYYVQQLRVQLATLPPAGPKPNGYNRWLYSYSEAAEDGSDWTDADDRTLGEMLRRS